MYNSFNNNPYYSPYPSPSFMNNNAQLPVTPHKEEVKRVSGRNGAEAYPMAPESSILLLDETAPIIWLKTTDSASYPTITGYQITPIKNNPELVANDSGKYEELEKRIAKLEEVINESTKSDVRTTKIIKQSTNE